MRQTVQTALGVLVALALVGVGWLGWNAYHDHHVVVRNEGGDPVNTVLAIAFRDARELKVRSATGKVQSSASDARMGGLLKSDRVVKLPFSVDYFLDLSRFSERDIRWNAASGVLTVRVPDIRVGKVNIDESSPILVQTNGIFVTRTAADLLTRRASARAHGIAQAEVEKPENLRAARESGRRQVAALMLAPLQAAKLPVRDVRILYPDEPDRPIPFVPMDHSRSLQEVLGLSR